MSGWGGDCRICRVGVETAGYVGLEWRLQGMSGWGGDCRVYRVGVETAGYVELGWRLQGMSSWVETAGYVELRWRLQGIRVGVETAGYVGLGGDCRVCRVGAEVSGYIVATAWTSLYLAKRDEILTQEASHYSGIDVPLKGKEWAVNDVIMTLKNAEISEGRRTSDFPPAVHFFHALPYIDKRAALHIHDNSITDNNWLIKNATYRSHCYVCFTHARGNILFHYYNNQPTDNSTCEWKLVETERANSGDAEAYDQMLYDEISMITDDPHTAYPNQQIVWDYFNDYFAAVDGLVYYADVFKDYFRQGLQEFYDDGIQFMEVRALLQPIYELDGTTYNSEHTLLEYESVNTEWLNDHQHDSMGLRIIFTSIRSFTNEVINNVINLAMELHSKYPHFMKGFDLVSQEDDGHPLVYFLEELLIPTQAGKDLPYYFHAGETNWQGTETDENLIDALMLNTSRIGHGYAATKHPEVLLELKQRDIPLEVNPISNQVLKLVDDLRNHPASTLLADGYPIVVSSDDPATWGSAPLSHDFYEMFMGIASAKADLRLLKQLTTDSIKYSTLLEEEKASCMDMWSTEWNIFLDKVLEMYNITDWEHYVPAPTETTITDGAAKLLCLNITPIILAIIMVNT
uniref:adenosine deaminase n=1 Tax=Saccoglossus kowalevskii TaxID=10224 RepID=A0ABM0MPE1_SACKO|nr:PREDICTED: adenosine deaminase CECR1-like [Saccoglossus kowalevskii]